MSATVAIIVPFFNAADTLPRLVDALKAQTYADFKALFVNDGSTDGGEAFVEAVSREDARFVLLKGNHGGPGLARNIGLDEADRLGVPYLTFVDADDLPAPDMLSVALGVIESSGVDIVHYQWSEIPGGSAHRDSIGKLSIYVWNKLYRRVAVSGVRFLDAKFAEDMAYFLQTETTNPRRVAVERPLYVHVRRESSLWESRSASDVARAVEKVVDALTPLFSAPNVAPRVRRDWFNRYLPGLLKTWRKALKSLLRESRRAALRDYMRYVAGVRFPPLAAWRFRLSHAQLVFRHVHVEALRERLRRWRWTLVVLKTRAHYVRRVKEVREKLSRGEKVRVVFVVSECAKWKTQSLYDLMVASPRFEPRIAITALGNWRQIPGREDEMRRTERYFLKRGMNPIVLSEFTTKRQLPLKDLRPDVVFYDQPWEVDKGIMPHRVSCYALTAYVPYFVPTHADRPAHYALDFFKGLFLYVQLNDLMCARLLQLMSPALFAGRLVGLGHTMFDAYYLRTRKTSSMRYVIYAPHWAFPHPNNVNGLDISTFLWSGRAVLEFAQRHPDLYWVFKPHPRLRQALVESGVWTPDEVDAYYAEWERVAVCCLDADYVELFCNSRAMITDCSSFLAEYPPCGGAMIHLRSPTERLKLHDLNDELYKTFYTVWNLDEMQIVFDTVLVKGEDPRRESRLDAVRRLGFGDNYAAQNILSYLENLL